MVYKSARRVLPSLEGTPQQQICASLNR